LTQHIPWQLVTCVQYGVTVCSTPFWSGLVHSRIGPPSRETSKRPLASKHMLTSEKVLSPAGGCTANSTLKPGGTAKRSSPPASQVRLPHGSIPCLPSTRTVCQPVS